jgi:tetratricopeptide (TPR) repeat protein
MNRLDATAVGVDASSAPDPHHPHFDTRREEVAKHISDIDALVRDLTDFQKEVQVEELLGSAVAKPQPTEERLCQIEQVLETFRSLDTFGRDPSRDLQQLLTMGRTYERLSHLKKACETYETALGMAGRPEDAETRATLLNRIGRVLSRWGRWEEALDHLDRSREVYRELGDEQGQARALVGRGIVFHEQGDYDAAAAAYEEALEMARRIGDQQIVANAINSLAVLATIRGDFDGAVARYQTCLKIFEEAGYGLGMARAYHNLGMTHADRRDWNAAMECYERGFDIAQEHGLLDIMANIYLGRAEMMLELGDTSMVALCCARAMDIYRKTENRLGEADTYRLLGRLFTLRKRWSTAVGLFQDSIRLNEEYSNPLNLAETHRDLGKLHALRGHRTEAKASFKAALAGFRKLGARADVAAVERLIDALDGEDGVPAADAHRPYFQDHTPSEAALSASLVAGAGNGKLLR